jgi:ketosteroid isomerase-like protein
MDLNTGRGSMIRRHWRSLTAAAAFIAVFGWFLISNHSGGGIKPPHRRDNMTNSSHFQYPTGTDEDVLRTLVQRLAETIQQEDYSMSQYLKPEDCHDYERFWKPMSETIKDYRESGSTITRIDAKVDIPYIDPGGQVNLNFRATFYFKSIRDGRETQIARRYGVLFKKEGGRWQANRIDRGFPSLPGFEGIPSWIFSPPHPMMSDSISAPSAGIDEFPEHSAEVSMFLRELTDAIQRRDASVLGRILAEDYVGIVGEMTNYYNKARQIAMVETDGSSVGASEFRNLRIYQSGAGETAFIAKFTGPSIFKISGGDSSAVYRHYLRLDKQSEQWTVSAIYISQSSSNFGSAEFTFTPK